MLIQEKINQAKAILKEFDIDCWITFVRESQLNGDPTLAFLVTADLTWHSAFIVTKSGETCAIVGKYDQKTVEETGAYDQVIGFVEGFKEPLLSYLNTLNPREIAVNYSEDSEICDGLTHGMFLTLFQTLSEIGMEKRLTSAERIVSALRERKSKTELEFMKKAVRITEEIFGEVSGFIRPGKTEQEIAAFMKQKVLEKGVDFGWEESVCPAVFTGPETADAHYAPTNRQVEPGQVLNMDFGVKYEGYCSDMQRTFYILKSGERGAPAEVMRGFHTIVNSIESARTALKPGVEGIKIDKISRDILLKAGYDEFPHALGHQVGRFSHDGTALLGPAWEKYTKKPFQKIEQGMVFTLEPRLTVPGRGVVTIEEMVVITASRAEYMSNPQKEIILIPSE
jgi:Xaa-Pro aminopeptidase